MLLRLHQRQRSNNCEVRTGESFPSRGYLSGSKDRISLWKVSHCDLRNSEEQCLSGMWQRLQPTSFKTQKTMGVFVKSVCHFLPTITVLHVTAKTTGSNKELQERKLWMKGAPTKWIQIEASIAISLIFPESGCGYHGVRTAEPLGRQRDASYSSIHDQNGILSRENPESWIQKPFFSSEYISQKARKKKTSQVPHQKAPGPKYKACFQIDSPGSCAQVQKSKSRFQFMIPNQKDLSGNSSK